MNGTTIKHTRNSSNSNVNTQPISYNNDHYQPKSTDHFLRHGKIEREVDAPLEEERSTFIKRNLAFYEKCMNEFSYENDESLAELLFKKEKKIKEHFEFNKLFSRQLKVKEDTLKMKENDLEIKRDKLLKMSLALKENSKVLDIKEQRIAEKEKQLEILDSKLLSETSSLKKAYNKFESYYQAKTKELKGRSDELESTIKLGLVSKEKEIENLRQSLNKQAQENEAIKQKLIEEKHRIKEASQDLDKRIEASQSKLGNEDQRIILLQKELESLKLEFHKTTLENENLKYEINQRNYLDNKKVKQASTNPTPISSELQFVALNRMKADQLKK